MTALIDRIRNLADQHHDAVIAIRRHIHMYPELSYEEEKTSAFVRQELATLEIPFTTGWAGHGVVATIEGREPSSRVIALRADMDALPITEQNEVSYRSQHPGVMHACGHDVHTASLLGVAMILGALRGQFRGTVRMIFQPAEEKLPGGAQQMIREGVLADPVPVCILGQHVHPSLQAGMAGFRAGAAMASSDEIVLRIRGKGGHGAMPHLTVDPVLVAAQTIVALQNVVSRNADPTIPSVLTFGRIASDGGSFNVIPDTVTLAGTFRTFDEQWRVQAHDHIRAIAQNVAAGFGASCDVDIQIGYPALSNEAMLTARCMDAARTYLGPDRVVELPQRMTAEDFAWYAQHIPGCFYRLGTGNAERGITSPVHTPTFDIDENALATGSGLMAWLAVCALTRDDVNP